MGGGPGGQPDDRALLQTLEINYQMLQGISRTMKSSQNITGVERSRLYAAIFQRLRKRPLSFLAP